MSTLCSGDTRAESVDAKEEGCAAGSESRAPGAVQVLTHKEQIIDGGKFEARRPGAPHGENVVLAKELHPRHSKFGLERNDRDQQRDI